MINQTSNKISIDAEQLYNDLMKLLKTPGPTQACVKISSKDPRIKGNFPIENSIKKIIEDINRKDGINIVLIRHMGNLLLFGGLDEKCEDIVDWHFLNNEKKVRIKEKIDKIPVIFGAHLDEISYFITKKKGFLKGTRKIFPICAPPQLYDKDTNIFNNDKTERAGLLYNPVCKIVGYRNGKFIQNIGEGIIYKVYAAEENATRSYNENKDIESILLEKEWKPADFLLVKITTDDKKIKEGDIVIQDYGDWKEKINFDNSEQIITSKAIDDRAGCIAAIYAVKELAKKGIASKAILTSAEEGIPTDISWGRMVKATYREFCKEQTITLVCDGIDGVELEEFKGEPTLSKAIILPYTSRGKGGGDLGLFARFRDDIIPNLKKIYKQDVAATTTDYSSRSFEIKIMDEWTMIGFIQWSCGVPCEEPQAVCHNCETIRLSQIINIIRTMYHSFLLISQWQK